MYYTIIILGKNHNLVKTTKISFLCFTNTMKVLEKYEKHRNKRTFKHYSKKASGRDWFFFCIQYNARVPVSKLAHI